MKVISIICLIIAGINLLACIMFNNIEDKINAGVLALWFLSASKNKES